MLEKFNNLAWIETGAALQGFWTRAVAIPETGKAPVAYDWYRGFLQALLEGGHHTWFAKLVVYGEMAIGIALILAWKTAGWIGLDRWLLPLVGTPWQPGQFTPPIGRQGRHPAEQPA